MAILRFTPEGKSRLEWPIGHILYESFSPGRYPDHVSLPEIWSLSPKTDNGGQGMIWTVDRQERGGRCSGDGPPWTGSSGRGAPTKSLFTGSGPREGRPVRAVSRSGRGRVLGEPAGVLSFHDVADDGRLLVERFAARRGSIWRAPGATQDKKSSEAGWTPRSWRTSLPTEPRCSSPRSGDGAGGRKGRQIPSPDGRQARPSVWATHSGRVSRRTGVGRDDLRDVAARSRPATQIGPGSPRKIATPGLTPVLAFMLADGKTFVVSQFVSGSALPSLT